MRSIAQTTTVKHASASAPGSSGSVAIIAQVPIARSVISANARLELPSATRTDGGHCMPPWNRAWRTNAIVRSA
jgi:hypothetical protein